MINYIRAYDFIYGYMYIYIREEASFHGLKTSTESNDPKIRIFMDT